MTAEELASIAGIVLSLLFSYIPGLKDAYDGLDGDYKRLVMGLSLVVVAGEFSAWPATVSLTLWPARRMARSVW